MYTEKQFSWLNIGISIFAASLLTLAYLYQWGQNPLPLLPYIVIISLTIIILLLFSQMRTVVDSSNITISYGIGCIKKVILLNDIHTIKRVKNKWYEGAGIKYLNGGMLYSISFTDSIELKFKNSDRFIRIGSRTPDLLEQVIRERI